MKINFKILFLVAISLYLQACKQNNDAEYYEAPKPWYNSFTKWIKTPTNREAANYYDTLNQYMVKQIATNQIDTAAFTLFKAIETAVRNYTFDTILVNNSTTFLHQYEKKIAPINKIRLQYEIAESYNLRGDYKFSITLLKPCITTGHNYFAKYFNAYSYLSIANAYDGLHKSDSIIKYANKALDEFELINLHGGKGAVYNLLGGMYQSMGNAIECENYKRKSLAMAKLQGFEGGIFVSAINLASFLHNQADTLKYFEAVDSLRLLYYQKNPPQPTFKLATMCHLGIKALMQHQYPITKQYIDSAKAIVSTDENGLSDFNLFIILLTDYTTATNSPMLSNKKLQAYLSEAIADNDYTATGNLSEYFYDEAIKQQDYKSAVHYAKLNKSAVDSSHQLNYRTKVFEIDKKYQVEKKEKQLLIKDNDLKTSKFQIAFLLILLMSGLLAATSYFFYRKRNQAKQAVQLQQQFTNQLFEKTEEERKRIATDLHDSVSHDLLDLKSENKMEFAQLNLKIDAIIEDVRSISRNLHPVLFESLGLKISLENMIERMQAQHNIIIAHDLNYNKELNTNDELQVYRIVQEALTNIVKYAQAPAAKVTIEKQHYGLQIVIKDSGKGFNVKEALASTKAFGLHNILQRSKTLGGNATITSTQQGTTITVVIRQSN